MSLQSRLADSVMNSGFKELITITPKDGVKKQIYAVVDRDGFNPQQDSAGEGGKSRVKIGVNMLRLRIYNDAIKGVSVIDENYTMTELPLRIGGAAVQMRVKKIVDQDTGMWHLQVEK